MRKRDIAAKLRGAERTIEFLRVQLCGERHDWVKADISIDLSNGIPNLKTISVCRRCGKRKVEIT